MFIKRCRALRTVFLLACLTLNNSALAEPNTAVTEGSIGEHQFKLNNHKPHCELSIQTGDNRAKLLVLQSTSPCYFFADITQKNIQTYAYPKHNIGYIALIGGTAAVLETQTRQEKKLSVDRYCTQDIQAILVDDNSIKLTKTETNAFACEKDRLDEKRYQQVIKQPRFTLKELEQQRQEEGVELSFFETLQQQLKAMFTTDENKQ
jgi:hypothetical protein